MRGLGLGIILTTIILSFVSKPEKLSDQEIIVRAKKLGMVTQEDKKAKLESVLGEITQPTATVAPKVEDPATEVDITDNPEVSTSDELKEDTDTSDGQETLNHEEATEEASNTNNNETSNETTDDSSLDDAAMESEVEHISFTIEDGMTSKQVADLLYEKGIIENAIEFNNYVKDNGKANVIRIGTYNLPKGASYDEIVKKITL